MKRAKKTLDHITMRDNKMSAKNKAYLGLLCAPLNVERVYSNEDIEEMQTSIEELTDINDCSKSDIEDYETKVEELNDIISDLRDQITESNKTNNNVEYGKLEVVK